MLRNFIHDNKGKNVYPFNSESPQFVERVCLSFTTTTKFGSRQTENLEYRSVSDQTSHRGSWKMVGLVEDP